MSTNPKDPVTVTLVEIPGESIEAWIKAAADPDPKLDFGRELAALIEKYKHEVEAETIATRLEAFARAVKARGDEP